MTLVLWLIDHCNLWCPHSDCETPGQHINSPLFPNEVESAHVESLRFIGCQGMTGQKRYWRGNSAAAQRRQEFDARHVRHAPIEDDNIGFQAVAYFREERFAVGETLN